MFLWIIILIVLLAGLGVRYLLTRMGDLPSSEEQTAYERLPYYKDGTFHAARPFAYYPDKIQGGSSSWLKFLSASANAPKVPLPIVLLEKKDFPSTPAAYALYWLGHSSAILDLGGVRLCIDPVLDNAAPVPGVVKRYAPSPLKRKDLPDMDYVLITHDHYDHLEYQTIRALREKNTEFIVPLGVGARLRGWGIPAQLIHELAWGETFEAKGGVSFTAEEAVHFSGRTLWDRNRTLWCSYIIEGNGKRIFWSGDTGYGEHFKRIGSQYGKFDLACMEIDAGNTGWPTIHLFPEQVIQACKDLEAPALLPIHWGVFDLALHPWSESISALSEMCEKEDIPLLTPQMGEKINPDTAKTGHWWYYE